MKSGFQKANNLAFCRLNALSSAKGTGIRTANSFAVLRLNVPSSARDMRAPNTTGLFALCHPAGHCSRRTLPFDNFNATTMDGKFLDQHKLVRQWKSICWVLKTHMLGSTIGAKRRLFASKPGPCCLLLVILALRNRRRDRQFND